MLLRVFVPMVSTTLDVRADICPAGILKGIDNSATDYCDEKEAACLPKERVAIKNSILAVAIHKPHMEWNIANALLCGKGREPSELVSPRIGNPLKEVTSFGDEPDLVKRAHRKAFELLEGGAHLAPKRNECRIL